MPPSPILAAAERFTSADPTLGTQSFRRREHVDVGEVGECGYDRAELADRGFAVRVDPEGQDLEQVDLQCEDRGDYEGVFERIQVVLPQGSWTVV